MTRIAAADPDVFDDLARELGDTDVDTAALMPAEDDQPRAAQRTETPAFGQRVGVDGSALVGIGEARQKALANLDSLPLISPGWADNTGGADLVITYAIPEPEHFDNTLGKLGTANLNRAARRRRGTKSEPGNTDRHVAWLIGCATQVYLTRGDIDDPNHERIHPSGDEGAMTLPAIDDDLAAIFGVKTVEEACQALFLRPGKLFDHSLDVAVHAGYIDDDPS